MSGLTKHSEDEGDQADGKNWNDLSDQILNPPSLSGWTFLFE